MDWQYTESKSRHSAIRLLPLLLPYRRDNIQKLYLECFENSRVLRYPKYKNIWLFYRVLLLIWFIPISQKDISIFSSVKNNLARYITSTQCNSTSEIRKFALTYTSRKTATLHSTVLLINTSDRGNSASQNTDESKHSYLGMTLYFVNMFIC